MLLGLAIISCSETAAPLAPATRTATASSAVAAADGSTLKAGKPIIVSPASNPEYAEKTVTIVVENARGTYVDTALNLEIELWTGQPGTGRRIDSTTLPQGETQTSWTPADELEGLTDYSIRARATLSGAHGPWSSTTTFTTVSFAPVVTSAAFDGDDINPFEIIYLHRNIADWEKISTITSLSIRPGQICFDHTGAGQFPQSDFGDISIEGNVWIFAQFGGVWYGATWDWLRPGQVCKGEDLSALGPDQIRIPPMDRSWNPASGTPICFAVSARARDEVEAGRVRSNIKCTIVP